MPPNAGSPAWSASVPQRAAWTPSSGSSGRCPPTCRRRSASSCTSRPPAGACWRRSSIARRALAVGVPSDGEPLAAGPRLRGARRPAPDRGRRAARARPRPEGERRPARPWTRCCARWRAAYGEHADRRRPVGRARRRQQPARSPSSRRAARVIVQDPDDAPVPSMPESAIARSRRRRRRAQRRRDRSGAVPARRPAAPGCRRTWCMNAVGEPLGRNVRRARRRPSPARSAAARCGRHREGELVRYRCRVGHAYSEDAMVDRAGQRRRGGAVVGARGARGARRAAAPDRRAPRRAAAAAARPLRRGGATTRAIAPGSSGGRSASAAMRRRPSTCGARRRRMTRGRARPGLRGAARVPQAHRAASTSPATSAPSLERRFRRRMDDGRLRELRRLPRLPRGPSRTSTSSSSTRC